MGQLDKLQNEGVKAFRAGNYELAQEKFETLVKEAEAAGKLDKMAEALNDLGVVKKQLDDLPGAIEALERALKHYQDTDNEKGEAQVLGNFGMVEEAAGKYEDAIQSYIDSATIFEELNESEMAMYSWQALSRLKMRQKEWLSAISAYEEGIAHLPDNSLKKKMLQNILRLPDKFIK